jgi:hypothetical protein
MIAFCTVVANGFLVIFRLVFLGRGVQLPKGGVNVIKKNGAQNGSPFSHR